MVDFTNRVNGAPFWGFAPGQVCMKSVMPSTSVTWGTPAWNVQYEIAINIYFPFLDMWQLELLDMGMQEMVTDQKPENQTKAVALRAIVDEQGKEVTQPELLNGHGKRIPRDKFGEYTADPVWFWHRKRYAADLNLLRIPNPFMV